MPLPLLIGASIAGRAVLGAGARMGARYIPKIASRLGKAIKGGPRTTVPTKAPTKKFGAKNLAKMASKGASVVGALTDDSVIDLDPSQYSVVSGETRGELTNPDVQYKGPSITNVSAANRYAMLMAAMGGEKQMMATPSRQLLPTTTSAGTHYENPDDDSKDPLGALLSNKKAEIEFVKKVVSIIEQYLAKNGGTPGRGGDDTEASPISKLKTAGMIGAGVLSIGAGNLLSGMGGASGTIAGGAVSGAGAGAALGTAILPGFGTAVGAAVGGLAGAASSAFTVAKNYKSDPLDVSKEVGGLSAKYESGSRGSAAVGFDSTGGTSYGKYQIATRTGTMSKFLNYVKGKDPEVYKRLKAAGSPDSGKNGPFAQEWKRLAAEGKLGTLEHDFIKATHFDMGTDRIKNKGIKELIKNSRALQKVMWSTSVQHGGGGAAKIFDKVYKEGMSTEDYIKAIYSERSTRFGSSSPDVRKSVMNRFQEEAARAIDLAKSEKTAATKKTDVKSAGKPNITGALSETYSKLENMKMDKAASKFAAKTPIAPSQNKSNTPAQGPKKTTPQPARAPSPSIQRAVGSDR